MPTLSSDASTSILLTVSPSLGGLEGGVLFCGESVKEDVVAGDEGLRAILLELHTYANEEERDT